MDEWMDAWVGPVAEWLSGVVFYEVEVWGVGWPLVVVWLVGGAVFFTGYLRGVNLWGLPVAARVLRGEFDAPGAAGQVTHRQALATALSGTVGIGNIGGVAVAIAVGGAGATLWMVVAGLLGMSTKLVECTLGVRYRRVHEDGVVSGGPMFYLDRGLRERGWGRLGRGLGVAYAVGIVVGCLGIGNMFQSNQAFAQAQAVSGGMLEGWGWLFGLALAAAVGAVILGGIRSIARVTERLVPLMGGLYVVGALVIIALNAAYLPAALGEIVAGAFSAEGVAGGALGSVVVGFRRAVFSNEAGIGSASIAHAAVRTDAPATEGLVALLEPLVDTVIICTLTALVITTTAARDPSFMGSGAEGVAMTSAAFAARLPWSPYLLAVAALLFAVSTMISWAYYGLKGWVYLFGDAPRRQLGYKLVFCGFVALGAAVKLEAVLAFSDAMVFLLCVPNILGLLLLAPVARAELSGFIARARAAATG